MTSLQKEILSHSPFGKIYYRNMYQSQHRLGYSEPGNSKHYDVYVAKDIPADTREIVLIHEIGHIYYGHLDIDFTKEIENIQDLFQKHNKDFSLIQKYGGPFTFLNICMDLEVNSKALTLSNINEINCFGSLVTPDAFKLPVLLTFRDYYEPLIEKLDDAERNLNRVFGQTEVPRELKDIPFQSDNPEIQKALKQEGYEQKPKDNLEEWDLLGVLGSSTSQELPIVPNTSTTLRSFLCSILKTSQEFLQDSFKHYNRGTRKGEILYTSLRLRDKIVKKKLGVVIDVSTSMKIDSIMQALGTLKRNSFLDPKSLLVLCNDEVIASYSITKLPEDVKIGGSTDISKGVEFLAKEGFKDCCIYSDMHTDLDKILRVRQKYNLNLYTIIVRDQRSEELDNYLQENEKYLFVTNRH